MSFSSPAWLYLLPFLVALLLYLRRLRKTEIHHRSRLEETEKSGIPEPLTFNSVIDTNEWTWLRRVRQSLS